MNAIPNTCPDCGRALVTGTPGSLCPACLLKLGEASTSIGDTSTQDELVPNNETPGTRIGRYKLLEPIGEGGFGTVWMAEQEEPVRRRVALKIIKLGMDTRAVVARFEAERQALALMDHPHIARVLDGGATEGGRPYFVMELVRGVPITDYCDTRRLSTRERLRLFIPVCQAVQHAHQKGIIHRDLKPSNILVTEQDGRPMPKVIDFGIAKATEQKLTEKTLFTRFNQMIGTPGYMSPEQAGLGGLDIDTRSDVYSLGVLLYELLTGRTPFDTRKLLDAGFEVILKTIREAEPPKPSTRLSGLTHEELTTIAARRGEAPAGLNKLLRGELDWIILKALEKDRARRYETANGLARDIERFLDNQTVTAAPPSLTYQFAKFARRNRTVLATTTAFALVLIASTAVSLRQAMKASRSASEEASQRKAAVQARSEAETNLLTARRNLYFADMSGAGQALRVSHLSRTRELLARHIPVQGETDQRGWEWDYLAGQSREQIDFHLPYPDGQNVGAMKFLPDGRHLLVNSMNKFILWNWPERTIARRFGSPGGLAVAVAPDGTFCAVAEADGVGIYQLPGGELISRSPMPRREGAAPGFPKVIDLAISPDGQSLCASINHGFPRTDFVLLRLAGPGRGDVKVWHLDDVAASHGARVAFSPDGKRLALGGSSGLIQIIRLPEGGVEKTIHAHEDNITALAFSPNSRILAVGSGYGDSLVRLYSIPDDWRPYTLRGHLSWIKALLFSPDGINLITGSADQTVRVWDLNTRTTLRTFRGLSDEVWHLALSPDGQHLLAGSKSGEIKGWDLKKSTSGPAGETTLLHRDVRLDQDLLKFAALSSDPSGRVVFGDVQGGPPRVLETLGTNNVWIEISPAGDRVAAMNFDRVLRVWNAANGTITEQRWLDHKAGLYGLTFLPGTGELATLDTTGELRRWNQKLELVARQPLPDHVVPLSVMERPFVRGSTYLLASQPQGGSIVVIDVMSGHVLGPVGAGGPVTDAAISPDGGTLMISDSGGGIWLWDTAKWGELKTPPLRGHLLAVNAVAFTPDGRRIISTGSSQDFRVWDAGSYQEICSLPFDMRRCMLLRFSRDGSRFAHGLSELGGVRVITTPRQTISLGKPPKPQSFDVGERLVAYDFNGGATLPWVIRRESTNHHTYGGLQGHLTIQTLPGGFYVTSTNYQNLFLTPMHSLALTNYAVVVKVDGFAPDAPSQQAGLILFNDEDNYLKLVVEPPLLQTPDLKRTPDQKRDLVMLREMNGVAIHGRAPLGGGTGPVWLRITRVGGRYIGESSLDGKNWDRATMLPWEFYGPDFAGIVAKNGDTSTAKSIPAHFDFFEIREVKTGFETSSARQ